jgi:uncharacterized protein YecT (DUF1311 family)
LRTAIGPVGVAGSPALLPLAALVLMLASVSVFNPRSARADEAYDACVKAAPAGDTGCGEAWINREQARLDAAWKALGEVADGEVAGKIAAEQKAWEAFRDLSCAFKLDPGFGGAGGPNGYHACRAEVIASRAAAIEAYLRYIDN